jgi:hypothetical protein
MSLVRPCLYSNTGTVEVLYDDHLAFVRNMRKIQGNKIELLETPNAPRDIFAAGQVLGFVEEVEAVMDAAINFLKEHGKR